MITLLTISGGPLEAVIPFGCFSWFYFWISTVYLKFKPFLHSVFSFSVMTSKLKKVRLPTLAGSIIWLACMGLWLIVSTCLNNWAKVSLHYQKPLYKSPQCGHTIHCHGNNGVDKVSLHYHKPPYKVLQCGHITHCHGNHGLKYIEADLLYFLFTLLFFIMWWEVGRLCSLSS